MQENEAEMSNDEQFVIEQVKEEKLLVARYDLI
jgi:hypothetical protein